MRNSQILQELCAGNPDHTYRKIPFFKELRHDVELPRQDSFRIADHTPPRNSPPTSCG
jgi:hypothetical protein